MTTVFATLAAVAIFAVTYVNAIMYQFSRDHLQDLRALNTDLDELIRRLEVKVRDIEPPPASPFPPTP
jgi:hypothetical protein